MKLRMAVETAAVIDVIVEEILDNEAAIDSKGNVMMMVMVGK